MCEFAYLPQRSGSVFFLGAITAMCIFAGTAVAQDAAVPRLAWGVPDFSSNNMGWFSTDVEFLPVPGAKFAPVTADPAHPYCANNISPRCGNQWSEPIADTSNPILQPWTAEQMKKTNIDLLAGKIGFEAMSRCWPGGVPGMMLFTREPNYFLQTKQEVIIVYMKGNISRHIYLNVAHSENPPPTWLGESVGHYEGDELVIDTIGLNDKTFVDWYHTPHTTKLHVVERYKLIDGGNRMQGIVTVDDPGAFTTEWTGLHYYMRSNVPISESGYVCAEDGGADFFNHELDPIPQADTSDF
jgi:hypothetical protein